MSCHSSRDEQNWAPLQIRTQGNFLLSCKETFHTRIGTQSSKTNLFPHSQGYFCLSSAPASSCDDPNLSEHNRILCPKPIYQSLPLFLHACKMSAFSYFHFLLSKGRRLWEKHVCTFFLSHLLLQTSNSIVLPTYLSFFQCLDISNREDGIYQRGNLAIRATMQLYETYIHH